MQSSSGRTALMVTGAIVVVVAAFFITTKILDYWGTPQESNAPQTATVNESQMHDPAYDAASLPHLGPGQTLTFANDQNKSALLSGWNLGAGGPWSAAHAAYLGFVVDAAAAPKEVALSVGVNIMPGKTDEQRVHVWSAGKKLAEFDLKTPNSTLSIPLSDVTVANGAPLILGFYLPDAKSPRELGVAPEPRPFAIFLRAIQLVP
jgi:hypothetical protein